MKYSGAEWVKNRRPDISEFGCQVADILGQTWRGIYHIDQAVLHKRVDWKSERLIEVVISGEIATYDFSELTYLVLLVFSCHQHAVRCSITGAANGYLKLRFSPRDPNESCTMLGHPTIEQVIELFNKEHGDAIAAFQEETGGSRC